MATALHRLSPLAVAPFPTYVTGVRAGDVLVSSRGAKQTSGSRLVVVAGHYPPSREALDQLSEDEWNALIAWLAASPDYAGLDPNERRLKLLGEATDDRNAYLSDDAFGLVVKVDALSGTLFDTSLSPEQRNEFIAEREVHITDIYKAIPTKKVGTRAYRHTLVFRPGNWTVELSGPPSTPIFRGILFDLNTVGISSGECSGVTRCVLGDMTIGVHGGSGTSQPFDTLSQLINSEIGKDVTGDIMVAREWTRGFTPSVHKSLIQKIIRTGALKITRTTRTGNEESVPGVVLLLVSFVELMMHPGVFVPDLQQYERGLLAATKRLAVSIFEDSYVSPDHAVGITSLLIGALMARDRDWYPTENLIRYWMRLAMLAHQDTRSYDYKTRPAAPSGPVPTSTYDAYDIAYRAIKTLKSFDTDENMVSWIAYNKGRSRPVDRKVRLLDSIPIIHCIDQHNHPELAYHTDPVFVVAYPNYGALFSDIWDKLSGNNPRTRAPNTIGDDVFIREIRHAQQRIYDIITHTESSTASITTGESILAYELDDSWVAGLIGPIEVKVGRRILLVSLDPNDVYGIPRCMLRPGRTTTTTALTDDERDAAINKFTQIIEEGVTVLKTKALPWLCGATIRRGGDGVITVTLPKGDEIAWSELKHVSVVTGTSVPSNADVMCLISAAVGELPVRVLQRLIYYTAGTRSRIELTHISRDGTGTEYATNVHDTHVYHFLSKMSDLFPGCIRPHGTRAFDILEVVFAMILYDTVKCTLSSLRTSNKGWARVADTSGRQLMAHQVETVNDIINSGRRVHLIDQPVGVGKTKEVCEVIKRLIDTGTCPEYVVYVLPDSAVDSVTAEFNKYGLPVVRIVPTGKRRTGIGAAIKKYQVNMITHDHMRLNGLDQMMRDVAPDALFVVDEFHLTLNHTIRTTIALEISKLARMCIAMSGTVIKDTHLELLIPWLEQVVEFEVNTTNFWTAMGAMIAHRIPLNITVNYINVEADPSNRLEYDAIVNAPVPRLSIADFRRVVELSFAGCTNEMIAVTMDYLSRGDCVMLVARNHQHQAELHTALLGKGLRENEIYDVYKNHTITLTGTDTTSPIRVVITTVKYHTGFTVTKMRVVVTSVYFVSQATRTQLEGRVCRLSQPAPSVDVVTVHAGILTSVLERHDQARDMFQAWQSAAKAIGFTPDELTRLRDLL